MSWGLLFPQDPSIFCRFHFSETSYEGLVAENNAGILSSPHSLLLPTTTLLTGSFLSFPKSSCWLYPCSEWTRVSALWGFMSSEASPLSVYTRPHGSAARGKERWGERDERKKKILALCSFKRSHQHSVLSPPDTSCGDYHRVSLTFLGKETHTSRCSVWGNVSDYYCCSFIYLFSFTFCLSNTCRVLLHLT